MDRGDRHAPLPRLDREVVNHTLGVRIVRVVHGREAEAEGPGGQRWCMPDETVQARYHVPEFRAVEQIERNRVVRGLHIAIGGVVVRMFGTEIEVRVREGLVELS